MNVICPSWLSGRLMDRELGGGRAYPANLYDGISTHFYENTEKIFIFKQLYYEHLVRRAFILQKDPIFYHYCTIINLCHSHLSSLNRTTISSDKIFVW